MATRRFLTAREQHEMLSPWRTAAPARHYDLEEALRSHGVVHTTGGRRLSCGHRHAVADQRTQESRLLDPRGWERHLTFTPSGLAVAGARAYTGLRGLQDPHQYDYTHVMQTPETVRTVGRLYDALPEHDPKAAPHFEAMRREINDQHDFITNRLGIRTEVVDHDPYSDVHEMMDDINHHKRMKVLGTHVTGGHPFFSDDENDKFRAVHDFFGHAATGRSFDRHGEQAAYLAHAQMFTPAARPALTSETKGQNASLILNGHFGPQKVAALPPEHWSGAAVDVSKLPRLRAPEPDQPGQDRRTAARRLAERADDLRWERDSSGNWILITRNPDGNPVAVRTERAPSVRTSRRTAMPAPLPENVTFHYHAPQDQGACSSCEDECKSTHTYSRVHPPCVQAVDENGDYVGHLNIGYEDDWDDWEEDPFKDEPVGDYEAPSMIQVDPKYRRQSVATGMFDFAKRFHPDLRHSKDKTPLGDAWAGYEENRVYTPTAQRTAMPEAVGSGTPLPGYEEHMRKVYDKYPPDSPDLPDSLKPHLMLPVDVAHHYREYDRPQDDENMRVLRRVIGDQGIRQPLKISTDGDTAMLVEGNHRINVARQLGMTHVPVQVFLEKPGKVMTNSEGSRPVPLEPVLADWIDKNHHTLRSFWD